MAETQQRIEKILGDSRIVLFMKGTPQFPQCGFSARAVAILQECGAKFASVDVLQDPEIREGIKAYGNWPTIPQLYVDKKLVGGSDIMLEMFEAGELQPMVK
ncbi:MAG TPA: Grx4 family monothiol glutaredoxin [Pseudobdellovibrionaceae bacterium]|jgi:monothiol glutaredoxin|nr:Grx4 family monothiol glutaredoxin [Pseudobdellovibrionaceae bacterium]